MKISITSLLHIIIYINSGRAGIVQRGRLNIIWFLIKKKKNYNSTSLCSTFFHCAKFDFELNFLNSLLIYIVKLSLKNSLFYLDFYIEQ